MERTENGKKKKSLKCLGLSFHTIFDVMTLPNGNFYQISF